MGERIISNCLNIHEKYKKVNIINPYRFGEGTTLKTDLISVWEMNETTGTDVFDAHGSNDGTNSNATINQTGKLDKCYSYNATTSEVNTNYSTDINQITISAWIYPESDGEGGGARIADKANWLLYFASGKLRFAHYFTALGQWETTSVITTFNEWKHVVVTYDNSDINNNPIIYIDGSSVSLTEINTPSGTPTSNSTTIKIGNTGSGSKTRTFDGLIDQTALWNKELTQTEVTVLYNSGNGLVYTNW